MGWVTGENVINKKPWCSLLSSTTQDITIPVKLPWRFLGTHWKSMVLPEISRVTLTNMYHCPWKIYNSPFSFRTLEAVGLSYPMDKLTPLSPERLPWAWIYKTFRCLIIMGLLPDTQSCGLRMRRECRERFPRHWLQRKPLISDHGMHHDTCVTHVPWCMPGSLIHGGGENVPGIPGSWATRNFTYLAGGPSW